MLSEDQWETWGKMVLNLTNRRGYAISEKTRCPHCKTENFHIHFHAEALECMNAECRKRYQSTVARPPAPGETTDEHFRSSLGLLFEQAKENQKRLPLLTQQEVAVMSDELKLLIARAANANILGTLGNVLKLAEKLAEKDG